MPSALYLGFFEYEFAYCAIYISFPLRPGEKVRFFIVYVHSHSLRMKVYYNYYFHLRFRTILSPLLVFRFFLFKKLNERLLFLPFLLPLFTTLV